MANVNTSIKFTYKDYKSLSESEAKRFELLSGELVMTPSPSFKHQKISTELEYRLNLFIRENDWGVVLHAPLDVVLGNDVVQPDILCISSQREDIIAGDEIRGAPDLIIEILSPSTAERDRAYKNRLYARYGVQEYWLVDPESQTIEVLHLTGIGYQRLELYTVEQDLQSKLLSGLHIALDQIF